MISFNSASESIIVFTAYPALLEELGSLFRYLDATSIALVMGVYTKDHANDRFGSSSTVAAHHRSSAVGQSRNCQSNSTSLPQPPNGPNGRFCTMSSFSAMQPYEGGCWSKQRATAHGTKEPISLCLVLPPSRTCSAGRNMLAIR